MVLRRCNKVGELVALHIYDVTTNLAVEYMNSVFRMLGTGAFHVAVEVFGDEWSYGYVAMQDPDDIIKDETVDGDLKAPRSRPTGVFCCEPGQAKTFKHRECIEIGPTKKSKEQVVEILTELSASWAAEDYDLLRHNCTHFCDEFCKRLDVPPLPAWVLRLASAGAHLDNGVAKMKDFAYAKDIIRRAKGVGDAQAVDSSEPAGYDDDGSSTRGAQAAAAQDRSGHSVSIVKSIKHLDKAPISQSAKEVDAHDSRDDGGEPRSRIMFCGCLRANRRS